MPKAIDQNVTESTQSPLKIGSTVRGIRFEYQIGRELGKGGRGHAFIVHAKKSLDGEDLPPGECVLKTVRIDERRPADEVFGFAARVHELLIREFRALRRLSKLPCVPEVHDFGLFGYTLQRNHETIPLTFIVSEFVKGKQLDKFLAEKFGLPVPGGNKKVFSGIPDIQEWFTLARNLATALFQIQQQEVVHRDIWHENILVEGELIRFIDFGDAYFRQELATQSVNERSDVFVAPEVRRGSRWPSRRADIYSMGGVLLYMASGQLPPNPPIDDDDELKRRVMALISDHNAVLLNDNHGVADIVARCLRSDHHRRIRDSEMLLEDLRIFDPKRSTLTFQNVIEKLRTQFKAGDSMMPGLFSEMAVVDLIHLSNVLEGMQLGAADINGDHEQLTTGLAHYLSVLDKGDEYLTVSTAEFWAPQNAGVNGRVLSMNRILAQRGVEIRRLFLVTPEDETKGSLFRRVASEHLLKCKDLPAGAKWETTVKLVDEATKEHAIDFFQHGGVWIKKGHAVKMLPVYSRADPESGAGVRTLRALRLRRYDGDVEIVRHQFEKITRNAQPLGKFIEELEKRESEK